jgi:asparagine synthase (glutamine-hydrolysing)
VCGIAGIAGPGLAGGAVEAALEAMVAVQHHRGPDDRGVLVDAAAGIALGHNRLSIIDLSAAGRQPMAGADGATWLVFNGEIYNYLELRAELAGYPFRTQTDSETILAAYARWGDACVERFIGMFAFALWDGRRRRLVCARDRLGIKPFHYAWHDGRFLFASEIKALLAAGLPARPSLPAWAGYLVHGHSDHGEETFFEGVRSLAPGHRLLLEHGRPRIERYWDLPARAAEPLRLPDDEAAARLVELFEDAVRLRLRSDVPLGVNLSGGLDSASLVTAVDRLLGGAGSLQTFTAAFADPRYDETEFAGTVAHQRPWARHVARLGPEDAWALAGDALRHQEAPYGGLATLAYHRLHQLARERGVKVLLEGQGVDELLAGYAYFRPAHHLDLLEAGRGQALRRELRASGGCPRGALDPVRRLRAGAAEPVYQDGTRHLRPECVAPELRRLAGAPPSFPAPFREHLANALYRDLRHTKLPRVLRMNDRLSMAASRELREPYLDHRLVELLFRLPGHQKIRLGQGKFLLRHAMAGRLPDAVRLADKRAVVTPQREWLRGPLAPLVEEVVSSRSFRERGLFDPAAVRSAWAEFRAGGADNTFFVWQWVVTELWCRMFADGAPARPGASPALQGHPRAS